MDKCLKKSTFVVLALLWYTNCGVPALQPRILSHRELTARNDLRRLGWNWRRSHYISFCKYPNKLSEVECLEKNFIYNSTSCACFSDSFRQAQPTSIMPGDDKSARSQLPQAECQVLTGIIEIPQPPNYSYLRHPEAVMGPICVGPFSFGWKCVPTKTIEIEQQVTRLDYNINTDSYEATADEYIKLDLPDGCNKKCTVDSSSCSSNQVFEPILCDCFCTKTESCPSPTVWNHNTCTCDCEIFESACGVDTRLDKAKCQCVSIYGSTTPSEKSKWLIGHYLAVPEIAEYCASILACFNLSHAPYFVQEHNKCICMPSKDEAIEASDSKLKLPTIMPPAEITSRCNAVFCEISERNVTAVADYVRRGCVCPCEKAHQSFALFSVSCPNHLCQIYDSLV